MALDKHDYLQKMELLLADANTYEKLKRNPVNKMISSLKVLLKSWKQLGYISGSIYNNLNQSVPNLPLAYGLPKIHKIEHPLRIIVSSIDSPLHNLAFIHNIINKSLSPTNNATNNSYSLINKTSNLTIPEEASLLSLDVISLFTNVPIDLVIDGISNRWHLIEKNTDILKLEFFKALHVVLDSTYFMFNDKFYRQTFGLTMGSPLSPILADIVMQDLEASCLNKLS